MLLTQNVGREFKIPKDFDCLAQLDGNEFSAFENTHPTLSHYLPRTQYQQLLTFSSNSNSESSFPEIRRQLEICCGPSGDSLPSI